MQKIFCDDGSTFVKLAYADEQKKLLTKITETSFLAGNWNFAFGQNIYNSRVSHKTNLGTLIKHGCAQQ
ncbi:plasmid segregation protein ParM domain-containing protein [Arsenophonus sp. ENCA]|uniref:plasmid segregation protein ParM domain-containing protein n=1 Tax=Arsenophonus sp. ENCA TaxID=1987579 RepID=UPI0025C2C036|nr:plasmid segregation protein ParM domain-containing protein [Arsenophonus sp. ENCA]